MAISYVASSNITVYPSGFRGEGYAQSKLMTEENVRNIKLLSKNYKNNNWIMEDPLNSTYVIIQIAGAIFRLAKSNIPAKQYCALKLRNISSPIGQVLDNYATSGSALDDGTNFKGLAFGVESDFSSIDAEYKLKIRSSSSASESTLLLSNPMKLGSDEIRNGDTNDSISSTFTTGTLNAPTINTFSINSISGGTLSINANITGNAATADSAKTAGTTNNATGYSGNVSLSAGTGADANKIKVTVGSTESSLLTVPYATSANSASSATTATQATKIYGSTDTGGTIKGKTIGTGTDEGKVPIALKDGEFVAATADMSVSSALKSTYTTAFSNRDDLDLVVGSSTDTNNMIGLKFKVYDTRTGQTPETSKYITVPYATKASKLANTEAVGGVTQPVYFSADGVPVACTYTLAKSVTSESQLTDTKNTAGTTYYTASDNTMRPIIGASNEQSTQTYSLEHFYISDPQTNPTLNIPKISATNVSATNASITQLKIAGATDPMHKYYLHNFVIRPKEGSFTHLQVYCALACSQSSSITTISAMKTDCMITGTYYIATGKIVTEGEGGGVYQIYALVRLKNGTVQAVGSANGTALTLINITDENYIVEQDTREHLSWK